MTFRIAAFAGLMVLLPMPSLGATPAFRPNNYHRVFQKLPFRQPTITLLRLDPPGMRFPPPDGTVSARTPAVGDFHGVPILAQVTLTPAQARALLAILRDPTSFEPWEPGAPGCVGWGHALRFVEAGRTVDLFYCADCEWLFSPDDAPADSYISLSLIAKGTARLASLFCSVLPPPTGELRCRTD